MIKLLLTILFTTTLFSFEPYIMKKSFKDTELIYIATKHTTYHDSKTFSLVKEVLKDDIDAVLIESPFLKGVGKKKFEEYLDRACKDSLQNRCSEGEFAVYLIKNKDIYYDTGSPSREKLLDGLLKRRTFLL